MIPKVINYCWFGGNPKPELIEKCIASWRKNCPDYEIIEWNESNYDVNKNTYMKEAYAAKKWAFVSDVARLDIIYNNGGVYLDTDVELFDTLDEWLKYDALFVFETGRYIATGLGFAAQKKNIALKYMLNCYYDLHFIVNGKINECNCPTINTDGLCNYSSDFIRNGSTQLIDGIKIISTTDYNKIAKHHYSATWVDDGDDYDKDNATFKPTKWKNFIIKPSHFDFVEKHFGKKAVKLYTFLCYDLCEFGIMHFIRKVFRKILKNDSKNNI